jgi:hypothetical protein
MSGMRVSVLGIAWFCPEEYDQLCAMFADGESLPETYHEWLKLAQNLFEKLSAEGHRVEKVPIDLVRFPAWCQQKGMAMSSKARTGYANEYVAMQFYKEYNT